jgi:hypothetical protein
MLLETVIYWETTEMMDFTPVEVVSLANTCTVANKIRDQNHCETMDITGCTMEETVRLNNTRHAANVIKNFYLVKDNGNKRRS